MVLEGEASEEIRDKKNDNRRSFQRNESLKSESSSNGSESTNPSSELSFIDRTPSESSLQLPFCPPVRVDYEDFPKAVWPCSNEARYKESAVYSNVQQINTLDDACPESDATKAASRVTIREKIIAFDDEKSDFENLFERSRSRRSTKPPEREYSIIPVENFSDFSRAIPSPVYPLPSSPTSPTFISCRDVIFEAPPEFSDNDMKNDCKKSHYVEIIIQISPPMAFATPILPPPVSFSTTVTRPNFPQKRSAVSRNSHPQTSKFYDSSIRSSMRDSGLADISPHVGRRRRRQQQQHVSSSQSFINSVSPTSGLSSDETGASLTGLHAAAATRIHSTRPDLNLKSGCCFISRPHKSGKKCLPFTLPSRRSKMLRRERSQSLDDSVMYNSCRMNNGLETEAAISCLDLPGSSLSADIFEDAEEPEELDSSYQSSGLYAAHWWLKNPVRKL